MDRLAESFRVLGDPTRLRILRLVAEAALNVSELVSLVGVAQSSVSHHLARLKALELIREERQAGFSFYSLALSDKDELWPLLSLAKEAPDGAGDLARLRDLLRSREDRQALNERLLEPGQSWFLWASALASLLPPLDVADFGCGTGALTVALAGWARQVVAIDRSDEALSAARARVEAEGSSNVRFLREDLRQLSVPPASFDVVILSQSLHHVAAPSAVLSEARRVLRPGGGRMIILELMPHTQTWVKERLGHEHLGFEPGDLERELSALGLTQLCLKTHARDVASPFKVFLLTGVLHAPH